MDNWAFFDRNGDEITRGWQGTEGQAREHAQTLANDRKLAIEFQRESDLTGYRDTEGVIHETPLDGEVVKPDPDPKLEAAAMSLGYETVQEALASHDPSGAMQDIQELAAQESCACCYGSGYVGNGDVPCPVCGGEG